MISGCRFRELMISGCLAAGVLHSGSAAASSVMMNESGSSGHGENDYSTAPAFADSGLDQASDSVRMALLSVTSGKSGGVESNNYLADVSEKSVVRDSGKAGDQHSPYEIEDGDDDNGKSGQVIQSLPAVPLPATAWLMLSGMGGLLGVLRRKDLAAG